MTMMSAEFLGMNLELPGSRKFLGLLPTAAHKSLPWKPLKSCPNMVRGQMKSLEFTPKHLVSYPKVSLGPDEKGDYRHPGSAWFQPPQDLADLSRLWGVGCLTGERMNSEVLTEWREIETLIRAAKSPRVNYESLGGNPRLVEIIALFIWVVRKQMSIKGGKPRRRCRDRTGTMRWVTRGAMPLTPRDIVSDISWLGISNIVIAGKPRWVQWGGGSCHYGFMASFKVQWLQKLSPVKGPLGKLYWIKGGHESWFIDGAGRENFL